MINDKVRKLASLDDEKLERVLRTISTEKFRAILEELMEGSCSEWFMDNDGRQWVVRQMKTFDVIDAIGQPTGEVKKVENIVGYYSKFNQAVARMYEEMLREELGAVAGDEIATAVARAEEIALRVGEVKE